MTLQQSHWYRKKKDIWRFLLWKFLKIIKEGIKCIDTSWSKHVTCSIFTAYPLMLLSVFLHLLYSRVYTICNFWQSSMLRSVQMLQQFHLIILNCTFYSLYIFCNNFIVQMILPCATLCSFRKTNFWTLNFIIFILGIHILHSYN